MFKVRFYSTASGNAVVLDFLRSLPDVGRKIVGQDLHAVQEGFPLGMPLCRPLGQGLWEVRSSVPQFGEVRLLFFHRREAEALVVTAAFVKKSRKTPQAEIDMARARMKDFDDG